MCSAEADAKQATELLQQDLYNGPAHCFGIHTSCITDYCKTAQGAQGVDSAGITQSNVEETLSNVAGQEWRMLLMKRR